jgi:hypothetical protein
MATFKFYQEYTYTRKMREYYEIEAESLEEARQLAEGCADLEDCEDAEFCDCEEIDPVDDRNFLKGTITIYDNTGEEIE